MIYMGLDIDYVYTQGWAGVRYYPDGSGAPPEPPEVDLRDMAFSRDVAAIEELLASPYGEYFTELTFPGDDIPSALEEGRIKASLLVGKPVPESAVNRLLGDSKWFEGFYDAAVDDAESDICDG